MDITIQSRQLAMPSSYVYAKSTAIYRKVVTIVQLDSSRQKTADRENIEECNYLDV